MTAHLLRNLDIFAFRVAHVLADRFAFLKVAPLHDLLLFLDEPAWVELVAALLDLEEALVLGRAIGRSRGQGDERREEED